MKTSIKTGLAALLLFAISCTKEPLRNPQASITQTQDNSAVQTTAHFIGERYGGGIIFYIDSTGKHGMIADTVDLAPATWSNGNTSFLTGASGTAIGTGKANTNTIVLAQGKPGNYAALECKQSKHSGKKDWYLPSKDELNELYKQRNAVGGFANTGYWSSSESYTNLARYQVFTNGTQYNDGFKNLPGYVRAVRAF